MSDILPILAGALADKRRDAELRLLAAVLADPRAGVPAAETAGITAQHFSWHDLKLIFCACIVQRAYSPGDALSLAHAALLIEHLIDDSQPAWRRGPFWSAPGLDSFAHEFFGDGQGPTPGGAKMIGLAVPIYARQLLDVDSRQAQAAEHLQLAEALLDGSSGPAIRKNRRPVVIMRRAS